MSFSPEELERYARHIVLREIGGQGQTKLKAASVLVVGAGGLGAPALLYLAAAGVGRIGLVDDDRVSLSNLQRQIIYRSSDAGLTKTDAAAEALIALNPEITVERHAHKLNGENGGIIADYNLVLDGTDNFATRCLVNKAAFEAGVPLVSGAISQWEGQVSVFDPARGGPCYACIFPKEPEPGIAPSCAEGGVVGALAGIIGSMMAVEAVKIVTGAGEPLLGRMMIFDALCADTRIVRLKARPDCPVCGG